MISKQECVDLLVKMGFKAVLESGVVMVSCKDKEAFKTAENAILKIGYKSSYGMRREINNENKDRERDKAVEAPKERCAIKGR